MDLASLYHRPESEFAYIYEGNRMFIRIRTKRDDVAAINLLSGDTYLLYTDNWYEEGSQMRKVASTDIHDYWEVETTIKTKRLAYGFHVFGQDDTEVFYCDRGVYPVEEKFLKEINYYFRMPFFHEVDTFKAPDWVRRTVWYQIFPDRFANGDPENDPKEVLPWGVKEHPGPNDFYGGDLQGILNKLDYLENLGVNGLYLTPIFEAETNHKYDTTDYKEIDSMFGDKKVLKELVNEAHKRGIRVMLDAVFNHMGYYSKQWQDVLKYQEQSKYKDWFHIHSFPVKSFAEMTIDEMTILTADDLNYDTFAFANLMPKLNTANPEVKQYLLDVATYWIREFDIDGWRLDVANEVDHQFWKEFHTACVNEKEDIYIIGEIWHSAQKWLEGDEFHAVMNYVYTEKIEDYFLKKVLSPKELVQGLNQQLMLYRKQTNEVQFNLLDSHDTPRILTKAGDNKELVKAILGFMFVQKGVPCIYYGTEVGLNGSNDPDCRKCMIWDEEKQDLDMLTFTKEIIAFRKAFQFMISYGDLEWHRVSDEEDLVGFKYRLDQEELTFYFSQNEDIINIPLPKDTKLVFSHLAKKMSGDLLINQHGFVALYNQK